MKASIATLYEQLNPSHIPYTFSKLLESLGDAIRSVRWEWEQVSEEEIHKQVEGVTIV